MASPQQPHAGPRSDLSGSMGDLSLDTGHSGPHHMHDLFAHDSESKIHHAPSSPVRIRQLSRELLQPSSATIEDVSTFSGSRHVSSATQDSLSNTSDFDFGFPHAHPAHTHSRMPSGPPTLPPLDTVDGSRSSTPSTPAVRLPPRSDSASPSEAQSPQIAMSPIRRKPLGVVRVSHAPSGSTASSSSHPSSSAGQESPRLRPSDARIPRDAQQANLHRPVSSIATLGQELHNRGRSLSPLAPQDLRQSRNLSVGSAGHSQERPMSYVDLMNVSYKQQVAQQQVAQSSNSFFLKNAVGNSASLLDHSKTLDMYRANVKKTNDLSVQYEFALLLLGQSRAAEAEEAQRGAPEQSGKKSPVPESTNLRKEARTLLQRLADRGYQYAQYYLADGYASGVFNNGKPDNDRAFPLFIAAGKHGHIEANYRAGLCYEFGWGTRKDVAKAAQFLRQAASKGHPGAATRLGKACLTGDMGLGVKYKDGIRWLKRAVESADEYHNSAPYELGMMHINGYGDDVFKDEAYAAQLLTQAAELGHAQAMLRMGEAYERGLLTCPKDPALSIHFYNGAAEKGIPDAMMALCAWYLVGAEPVLLKSEEEAYQWAHQAAETGMPKAQYAVGYFTEMGMGCRRDPLEANVWYVRAADQGDERAKQRLRIIREAELGEASADGNTKNGLKKKNGKHDDKDCVVM